MQSIVVVCRSPVSEIMFGVGEWQLATGVNDLPNQSPSTIRQSPPFW